MSNFGYEQNITYGGNQVVAKTALDDELYTDAEYLFVKFRTHFEGDDLVDSGSRRIRAKFIDEMNFLRDVQQVVGENYFNYFLFTMFYREKPYSLNESLLNVLPDDMIGGQTLIAMLLNTNVMSFFFEDLKQMPNKRLDLRCSFSKDYLKSGHLGEKKLSRLSFREGDMVDLELHFGCGVYVFNGSLKSQEQFDDLNLATLIDLMTMLSSDPSDESKWKPFRSFFASMEARVELDLSPEAKVFDPFGIKGINMVSQWPFIFGKIINITPTIHELKVFNGD